MKKTLTNFLMFALMIAIGFVGFIWLNNNKQQVEHAGLKMDAKPVDVIKVEKQPFNASVTAYGNVEPAIVLQSKAEVSGKVTYVHPDLKAGGSIAADTVVVRIDTEDYQVSLSQTQADLASSESQLAQLKQERASTQRSLSLAKKNLALGEKELERIRSLSQKGLLARSTLDAEEQKVIQLEQSVSDLQGQLTTYSSRIANADAQIRRSEQQVKGQKTTLQRTEIKMPFDARISVADVEKGEFVSVGNLLFEAINTDGVEIEAELPMQAMKVLLLSFKGQSLNIQPTDVKQALQRLQLKARVRLVGGKESAVWQARVSRISESVDPTRRTLSITVAVDNPYENIIVGERPPLLKGMYVAVELYAPAIEAIVIPRSAIHDGRAFVVGVDNQLEIRRLAIQSKQNDLAIISHGLEEGDWLIVNDLYPVIDKMPLAPQPKLAPPSNEEQTTDVIDSVLDLEGAE